MMVEKHSGFLSETIDRPDFLYYASGCLIVGSLFEIIQNTKDRWYITAETARATAAEATNNAAIVTATARAQAAEAALLDSIHALDSIMAANSLWSDDGNGNIQNTNS